MESGNGKNCFLLFVVLFCFTAHEMWVAHKREGWDNHGRLVVSRVLVTLLPRSGHRLWAAAAGWSRSR